MLESSTAMFLGVRFSLRDDGILTRNQVRFLACLIAVLWLINLPRGIAGTVLVIVVTLPQAIEITK